MKILNFKQFENFRMINQKPLQRSFPGKEQTITLPNGDKVTGKVEKVSLDTLVPTQESWDIWNETSKGYAKGLFFEIKDDWSEDYFDEGDILSEDNLPPIVVDSENKIIDGHHRWAALQYDGFEKINIIRYEN